MYYISAQLANKSREIALLFQPHIKCQQIWFYTTLVIECVFLVLH